MTRRSPGSLAFASWAVELSAVGASAAPHHSQDGRGERDCAAGLQAVVASRSTTEAQ